MIKENDVKVWANALYGMQHAYTITPAVHFPFFSFILATLPLRLSVYYFQVAFEAHEWLRGAKLLVSALTTNRA